METVGRAKHTRARNFEETRISRARVYFARSTIAIAKIRDYSQSNYDRFYWSASVRMSLGVYTIQSTILDLPTIHS